MDPATIISIGLTGLNQLTKMMAAAQAGNVEEAQSHLRAAREHFSTSLAAWDAAGAGASAGAGTEGGSNDP